MNRDGEELPRLDGVRVLVVDDSRYVVQVLVELLELCGATVTGVLSATEALEALQGERPDVLVSDISMPIHDGFWLIQKVRALPAELGGATPAAALTGETRAEDRARMLAAGFQYHIAKPVDMSQLAAVVALLASKG